MTDHEKEQLLDEIRDAFLAAYTRLLDCIDAMCAESIENDEPQDTA